MLPCPLRELAHDVRLRRRHRRVCRQSLGMCGLAFVILACAAAGAQEEPAAAAAPEQQPEQVSVDAAGATTRTPQPKSGGQRLHVHLLDGLMEKVDHDADGMLSLSEVKEHASPKTRLEDNFEIIDGDHDQMLNRTEVLHNHCHACPRERAG